MVCMTSLTLTSPPAEALTERFDPIECLDGRIRGSAPAERPLASGRYLEVRGAERSLMIPIGEDPLRIGRGLSADVHIDENSVSRRHAIVVPEGTGVRILDDRSSNGTLVNGRAVEQARLSDGDTILIGRVPLRYIEV